MKYMLLLLCAHAAVCASEKNSSFFSNSYLKRLIQKGTSDQVNAYFEIPEPDYTKREKELIQATQITNECLEAIKPMVDEKKEVLYFPMVQQTRLNGILQVIYDHLKSNKE